MDVNATSSPVMATCSFPSGFTGDALCRVDFTGPDGVTYTSVSTERGSAGESVTVELTLNGAALLQNTTYYYQATLEISTDASQCVKGINATGNFTTGDYGSSTGTHTSELELTRMFKSFIIDAHAWYSLQNALWILLEQMLAIHQSAQREKWLETFPMACCATLVSHQAPLPPTPVTRVMS